MIVYAITEEQANHERTIGIRSSKEEAVKACEEKVSDGKWNRQDKHFGRFEGKFISCVYEMYRINEKLK